MNTDIHSPDKWLSFGLAFVGGYCDAGGLVVAKTFTGHITGSLVLGAITIAELDWRGALAHFSSTACFLAGIPLSVLIARLVAGEPSFLVLRVAMGIEAVLIVAAYFSLTLHGVLSVEIFIICMSLALGLQNGAFRRTGGVSVHTTYLTGMITSLISTEVEKFTRQETERQSTEADPPLGFLFGLWGAFVLGAAVGAGAVFHFKAAGILGATLVLLALIIRSLLDGSQVSLAN